MADFKKITDVPMIEEPIEGDSLMIISEGELKQISASSFAAASSGGGLLPVFLYGGSTSGGGAEAYIYDPNGVGITTSSQLVAYMLSGGNVYWVGVGEPTSADFIELTQVSAIAGGTFYVPVRGSSSDIVRGNLSDV